MIMLKALRKWVLNALLIVPLALQSTPVATENAGRLKTLADEARSSLAEIVEPPAGQLGFASIVGRSEGAPIREYVLRQQTKAIEALVVLASTPRGAQHVPKILSKLGRYGFSESDAEWLAKNEWATGPEGIRLAASLEKLPAALHERIHVVRFKSVSYELNRKQEERPLGKTALEDYIRLTELEPDDPWHWLVLAWLEGTNGESALHRCLAVARAHHTPDSLRAQIFAWQQIAWLRRQQNQLEDAETAATEAVRVAETALPHLGPNADDPRNIWPLRDLVQTKSALAIVLDANGKKRTAFALLENIEQTQRLLAESQPKDFSTQYALIETWIRLDALEQNLDSSLPRRSAAIPYSKQAFSRYLDLLWLTPFKSSMPHKALLGTFLFIPIQAGLSTLLLGLALLWLYRRRVGQLMGQANLCKPSGVEPCMPKKVPVRTSVKRQHVDSEKTQRRAALVQVIAGFSFGIAAAFAILNSGDIPPTFNRVAILTWSWAWPTIVAWILIWDGDRTRNRWAWGVYLAGTLPLSTLLVLSGTPALEMYGRHIPAFLAGQYLFFSQLSAGLLVFLFLNRAVRSIGPPLFVMMLIAFLGAAVAYVSATTPVGMSLTARLNPYLSVEIVLFWLTPLAGLTAFSLLAFWVGRILRSAYAAKWISDQTLIIDALWLFQATQLSSFVDRNLGNSGWTIGLGVFVLYKAIVLLSMWPSVREAREAKSVTLLVLRVFSYRNKKGQLIPRRASAERLFDLLSARWRYLGPIYMIGAPDLASTTITPDKFLDFLGRRLNKRFIMDPAEVPIQLTELDERCDLDARWRVNEFFCANEAWRAAVISLIARSDQVAMDLRNFGNENQGCLFELQSLHDLIPLDRVVLFVDQSTDMALLNSTLDACVHRVSDYSPNARSSDRAIIINVDRGERAAVNQLMHISGVVQFNPPT